MCLICWGRPSQSCRSHDRCPGRLGQIYLTAPKAGALLGMDRSAWITKLQDIQASWRVFSSHSCGDLSGQSYRVFSGHSHRVLSSRSRIRHLVHPPGPHPPGAMGCATLDHNNCFSACQRTRGLDSSCNRRCGRLSSSAELSAPGTLKLRQV